MSTLNFQRALAIGFIVWAVALVSGCASSVPILSDLVGSKPDMTAQVGAENVKQAVGVTNKTDTSSKQETTFKESAVGKGQQAGYDGASRRGERETGGWRD
nr:Rz-like spanin [Klebsiella phage vB_Kpn_K31PH164]